VLLGETTVEQLGEAVVAEPLADLDLKGKSDPVRAWELREVKAVETRQLSAAPMVGRLTAAVVLGVAGSLRGSGLSALRLPGETAAVDNRTRRGG
jgi:hypothetical protein